MSHWDVSTLSEDRLLELEEKELLPPWSSVQWRAAGADREPRPLDGEIVLFEGYLYAGLRLPENPFLREVIQDAGLELVNLNPNSVLMVAVFVHLCEAFVGVKPTINIFKHYYAVYWGKGTGPLGCVYFRLRNDMAAGYPLLPTKDSLFGWHRSWFYTQVPQESSLLYKKGQKPQRAKQKEALEPLSKEEEKVVLAIKCLTDMGLTGRAIVTDWLTNRVSPLRRREKAFFEMEGPEDVSRDSSISLDPEEVKSRLRYLLKTNNEDKEQPKNVLERSKGEKVEFGLEARPVICRKWTTSGGDDLPKRKRAKRVRKGQETPPSTSSRGSDDRRSELRPFTTSSSDEEGTAIFTKYKKIVAPSPLEVLASAILKNTSGSESVSIDEQRASIVRDPAAFTEERIQDAAPAPAIVVMGDEQTTDDNGFSHQIPVPLPANVLIGVEHTSDASQCIKQATTLPADKNTAINTDLSAGHRAMVFSSTSTTSDPSSATAACPSGTAVSSEQSRFEKELMDVGTKSINEMVRFATSFVSQSVKAAVHKDEVIKQKDELIKQKDQLIKRLANELKLERRCNEQLSDEVAKISAERAGLRKELLGGLKKLEERINLSP